MVDAHTLPNRRTVGIGLIPAAATIKYFFPIAIMELRQVEGIPLPRHVYKLEGNITFELSPWGAKCMPMAIPVFTFPCSWNEGPSWRLGPLDGQSFHGSRSRAYAFPTRFTTTFTDTDARR